MPALESRVAIVTGGGKGIGVAYCEALAAAGASIVIVDIVDAGDLAARLERDYAPIRAISVVADVSDEQQVIRSIASALTIDGRIDVLVNNAAIFAALSPSAITDIDVGLWDKVMAVNVRGAFLMAKHVTPHMTARRYGKIINITSGAAYKGLAGMLHYSASKGALMTMTRALSRELGADGICVNSLAPGAIMSDTIMENEEHLERYHSRAIAGRAIPRHGYPSDLTGALVFLASTASDFITGQTLAVDGGSVNT